MGLFNRRGVLNQGNLIKSPENIDKEYESNILDGSNNYDIWKLVAQLRELDNAREYRYAEYDIMESEVIIRSALNMYSDDATQRDENSNRIYEIISDNETLRNDLYSFLDRLDIEKKSQDTVYNLAKYGNRYWKLYLTEDNHDIDHIEEIDSPGDVLDLYYQGKPVFFAQNADIGSLIKSNEYDLYDHSSFVHLYIRSGNLSEIVEIPDNTKIDDRGNPVKVKYKLIEGESLLEGVRSIYRILRTLEDSLLAARLAKAEYIRVFNIEVGDMGKTDVRIAVNKVKKLFDSSVSLNIRDGKYTATKQSRGWGDPIFNSTSNGKGALSTSEVGGDFEVKSIVDIDYFNNKLFAGLRIPKPFLGIEESVASTFGNDNTMVQLDIRYGKFIKKLIDASTEGITELCNIWLKLKGRDKEIGKFKIAYNSPSSSEELARLEELKTRIDIIIGMVDALSVNEMFVNKVKMLKLLLEKFVGYPDLINKINPILNEAIPIADLDLKLNTKEKEKALEELENPPEDEYDESDDDFDEDSDYDDSDYDDFDDDYDDSDEDGDF